MLLTVLVLAVAFAVDLGRLTAERRDMQADADVIALDLGRLADGRTEAQILSSADYATTLARSAAANDIDPTDLVVEYGVYDAGLDQFVATADDEVPNAVQVDARSQIDYYFARVIGTNTGKTVRSAIASQSGVAGFEIGSTLVSVDTAQADLLNQIFSGTLGGSPGLDAAGYNGLANATIPLGPLATDAGFGSPDEMANATMSARDFYLAAADVMEAPPSNNVAAANALNAIATNVDSTTMLDMGKLLKVEQGGEDAAAAGSVDLFPLVTGSAFAIDGTNTVSIPALTINVPGVGSSTISLSVIEKPQSVFGPVGATVSTSQVSLGVTTTLSDIPVTVPGLVNVTASGTVELSPWTSPPPPARCRRSTAPSPASPSTRRPAPWRRPRPRI